MNQENLARQAELALDRRGGYDSLLRGPDPVRPAGFHRPARGGGPAYSDRDDGGPWQTRQQAPELAAGLIGVGLQPGERVALMLPNRVGHVLADLGAVHAAGGPVTFYPTLAADRSGTSPAAGRQTGEISDELSLRGSGPRGRTPGSKGTGRRETHVESRG